MLSHEVRNKQCQFALTRRIDDLAMGTCNRVMQFEQEIAALVRITGIMTKQLLKMDKWQIGVARRLMDPLPENKPDNESTECPFFNGVWISKFITGVVALTASVWFMFHQ